MDWDGFALHSCKTWARGLLQNSEVARSEVFGAGFEVAANLAAAASVAAKRSRAIACAHTLKLLVVGNFKTAAKSARALLRSLRRSSRSPLFVSAAAKSGSSPIASLRSDAARLTSSFFKYQPARLKYDIASRW